MEKDNEKTSREGRGENDGSAYLIRTEPTPPLNLTPISEAAVEIEVPKTPPKKESGDGSSAGNSARIFSITEEEAAAILLQIRNKNFDPDDESLRGEEIPVSSKMLTVAHILVELQDYEIQKTTQYACNDVVVGQYCSPSKES
ncbi:hypothetical protein TNIN_175271 [Trichonephila inaurata madagascariensis]|uniref:Uncharacterized protein n=1 Tax=Trichonephila inaurata madagascariensis TaxID=2747483 RepID=A0A8X6XIW8_9ARAC|nr:hypothetical protein TNIN_175271 [Trichonephila inaurata madagascariensis]